MSKCLVDAHVDALVIAVLELLDALVVIRNHPILPRAVLHAAHDDFGHLPLALSSGYSP